MTSATIGKPDRNMPDHFASAVMALTLRNSLKRDADHLGEAFEDFGKVPA